MLQYTTKKYVDVNIWNKLVEDTYGRPYNFQQQDGCRDRGIYNITIPSSFTNDNEMNGSIPEVVNGDEMGVKFKIWLDRDPKQPIPGQRHEYELLLFWERNFYPDIETIANDLYEKGLLEAGDYTINIDW